MKKLALILVVIIIAILCMNIYSSNENTVFPVVVFQTADNNLKIYNGKEEEIIPVYSNEIDKEIFELLNFNIILAPQISREKQLPPNIFFVGKLLSENSEKVKRIKVHRWFIVSPFIKIKAGDLVEGISVDDFLIKTKIDIRDLMSNPKELNDYLIKSLRNNKYYYHLYDFWSNEKMPDFLFFPVISYNSDTNISKLLMANLEASEKEFITNFRTKDLKEKVIKNIKQFQKPGISLFYMAKINKDNSLNVEKIIFSSDL